MESKCFTTWLSDSRNLVITFLSATAFILALLIALATISSVTAPSPYERRDRAEAARVELRDRINAELANQTIINRDVYSQIEQLKVRLGQEPKRYERPKKAR